MRKSLSALFVAGGVLIGYGVRGIPVSAQPDNAPFLPFTANMVVRLKVDLPEGVRLCTVLQVVNGFIGCAADRQSGARWINLRNVQEITPAPER